VDPVREMRRKKRAEETQRSHRRKHRPKEEVGREKSFFQNRETKTTDGIRENGHGKSPIGLIEEKGRDQTGRKPKEIGEEKKIWLEGGKRDPTEKGECYVGGREKGRNEMVKKGWRRKPRKENHD